MNNRLTWDFSHGDGSKMGTCYSRLVMSANCLTDHTSKSGGEISVV